MKGEIQNGIFYPSVSEILNVINKPELNMWYMKSDYQEILQEKEKSTQVSQAVHNIISHLLSKKTVRIIFRSNPTGDTVQQTSKEKNDKFVEVEVEHSWKEEVKNCINGFHKFCNQVKIMPIKVKLKVFHHLYYYCGEIDAICSLPNESVVLIDWKVTNKIHKEDYLQLAAYKLAYENSTREKIDECWIVRLDKKTAEYEIKQLIDVNQVFSMFLHAYHLWYFIFKMPNSNIAKKLKLAKEDDIIDEI